MTKRRCSAKTKAGKPCGAAPLKHRDVCLAHADAKTRDTTGFVPDNGFQGRKKQPRTIDVLRERLEERADEIIDVYLHAARAVTDEGEPDHPVRLRAVEALHDRAYGKPKQVSEISGPEGGPVEHQHIPTEEEFHRQAARLLADAGALDS